MLVETKKAAYTIGIQDICYQSKNPFIQWILGKRLHIILEMAEKTNNAETMVDFGSGWGLLLPSLSRIFKTVYGVDINKVRFANAPKQ